MIRPLQLVSVTDSRDPRLEPFQSLPLRKASHSPPDAWFVAEGRLVVERLLRSPFAPAALLVAESKRAWVQSVVLAATGDQSSTGPLPVYLLPDAAMPEVVGFDFHSGILGAGLRHTPPAWNDLFESWFQPAIHPSSATDSNTSGSVDDRAGNETLLVLPAMNSAENLGSIIRSARGLGAAGAILSAQSADPLSRRVIRVSMGHALAFPCYQSPAWRADLLRLRAAGFRLVGMEHHPRMQSLHQAPRYRRQALVMGNEFAGLDGATLDLMDDIVGIPMHPSVDSLNVAVTAAIALHHYLNGEQPDAATDGDRRRAVS